MSDKLLKVIEDLQSNESLNSLLEADISRSVILRILDVLNWNTSNRREVNPEYSVKGGRVDFALLTGNRPKVFIEVKRGGEPLVGHQEQLLGYAFRQGVKVAILTNGATWWFYLPLQEGNWEERRFATVEFDRQDKEEIVQKLETLLGKENVISGKAVQNAEILYEQSQKKEELSATLPEAWNQLVGEPDDLLIELLVEKTEKLCGHKPDKNEVEQFLLAHFPIIDYSGNVSTLARKAQVPLPSQPKGSAIRDLSELPDVPTYVYEIAERFDGIEIEHRDSMLVAKYRNENGNIQGYNVFVLELNSKKEWILILSYGNDSRFDIQKDFEDTRPHGGRGNFPSLPASHKNAKAYLLRLLRGWKYEEVT